MFMRSSKAHTVQCSTKDSSVLEASQFFLTELSGLQGLDFVEVRTLPVLFRGQLLAQLSLVMGAPAESEALAECWALAIQE